MARMASKTMDMDDDNRMTRDDYWNQLEIERSQSNKLYKSMNSSLFNLNWKDIGKAFAMFVITPIVGYIYQILSAGGFDIDWHKVLVLAASGAVAYLLKQLGTDSQGNLLGIGSVRE
jgi:hypothetical protein